MPDASKTLIELETKFWQSMVDQDTSAATALLNEPAVMVSQHGAMQFDHAGYRKMADQGSMVVNSFELADVKTFFPNDSTAVLTYRVTQGVSARDSKGATTTQEMNDSSIWVKSGSGWKCIMHTETPVAAKPAKA